MKSAEGQEWTTVLSSKDKALSDRTKLEELEVSTENVKAEANREIRRSLELSASFYEKLVALNAASIALAVSVGVALLSKAGPRSTSLHSNLNWLVVLAFFLWISLICAFGHNTLYIKLSRLESERALEWSKWIALVNAGTMQSITAMANSKIAQELHTHIGDTLHGRIEKAATNLHRSEQTALRARLLGGVAISTFLMAYTLVFVCVIRIWWITR